MEEEEERGELLLSPLFEELVEIGEVIDKAAVKGVVLLGEALESAKELLGFCSRVSRILLVMKAEKIRNKFQELTVQFDQAVSFIAYDKLDISVDLKEQATYIEVCSVCKCITYDGENCSVELLVVNLEEPELKSLISVV